MAVREMSRRHFLEKSGVALAATAVSMTAKSYARVLGANDRINIGLLGCGSRSRGHRRMVKMSEKDMNLRISAVCDIWKVNRQRAADDVKQKFGYVPKMFKYSEDMLAMPDLDAVMIATGDHQHAKLLAQVVQAGKDCYCEKPMANTLEEAKLARDAVLNSDQVVQMGSQWVSDPYQHRVREIIRSGKLGQITKIEQVWNYNGPRWHNPNDPDIKMIREEDTDWVRWLLGRPYIPFDPQVYFEFRIYREFSGGITDQWMSHAIGLVNFYMDTDFPTSMVANGGIFAWHDTRQNPDTFQALATYDDKQFLYSYSTCFGNGYGSYTRIMGKEGTLVAQGGEGSPRWFFFREGKDSFDPNLGLSKEALRKGELITLPGHEGEIPPTHQSDDSKYHLDNWITHIRSRDKWTNGHIYTGYWHSVGIIMATRAYREGKKLYWDREKEEIVENPVRG